jgi:hypothetical protein
MDSIKDVDTMKYYTINKRIVKSGGGIYPDVFVPIDTNFDLTNFSLLRSVMPDYVYSNQAKIESLSKMNINEITNEAPVGAIKQATNKTEHDNSGKMDK